MDEYFNSLNVYSNPMNCEETQDSCCSIIENRMILKKESDANLSLLNSGFTPSSLGSNLLIGSKGSLLAIFFNSIVKNIQSLEIGTIEFSSSSELFKKH